MSAIKDLFADQSTATAAEVGAALRCSTQKVRADAAKYGIGSNLGGRAGWRFTEADVNALLEAARPGRAFTATVRRRRRAS